MHIFCVYIACEFKCDADDVCLGRKDFVCDGHADCLDRQDEMNCGKEISNTNATSYRSYIWPKDFILPKWLLCLAADCAAFIACVIWPDINFHTNMLLFYS